ncbi:hypothetical protein ACFL9U_04665 [Thermodesulfobacteriota bacterium]
MKIVFIHYHLKTGGVTTVLRQQVEAVRQDCDILVLTGKPGVSDFPADTVEIPGLSYDNVLEQSYKPEEVVECLLKEIHSKWHDGCDVIHVHNPTLAKNKNLLKILKHLQAKKLRLFLQIHDFAEDGRPSAYFEEDYIADCHYGVINSRDYDILIGSGLIKNGLHNIPNMVTPLHFDQTHHSIENRILYPIRAIRRKNIGEAILLSLFFRNHETLDITLPPNSDIDIKSYRGWKNYVKENNLNVHFDAGLNHDFGNLVISSRFLITTSINEGFGFSFLEPWTAGKILWGRKLPENCRDFAENGIRLDHLYTRLLVPLEWIGKETFSTKWKACFLQRCANFDYTIAEDSLDHAFEKLAAPGAIDFGLLDENFQKQVISCILSDKETANRLISLNPYLSNPGAVSDPAELIQNNLDAILYAYNESSYREKLLGIYAKVARTSVRQRINKKKIVLAFLDPEQFSLLKWSDYHE